MKTVFYANVDGFDIVLGFSDAIVDPMATAAIVGPILASSDEAKAIADVNAQIDAIKLRMYRETPTGTPYSPALLGRLDELAGLLPPLGTAFDLKRAQHMDEKAVYFQPHEGENLCTVEQVAQWESLAADGLKVKLDGTTVVDNRGASYWQKGAQGWAQTLVTCLGVEIPAGAVLTADLTDAQKTEIGTQLEAERVAALTDDARLAEAQGAQAQAKAAVVQVAGEVGAGISDQAALDAAKVAYHDSLAAVNKKYGTNLT